ncbi:Mrp/NBP35 family ATP-binding protein [Novosphingobium sp.]|uniref:Mrp/NBP35 family ATP-binding protein n=1 Tax=Novosphingobium sp. TaxID=1874826 RepID=UPI002624C8A8|nr:Mrp/NBP35 family ATP-binding protein [Novosphingobium sp.]
MAAGARLQTARTEGETASIILEVSGLDRAGRDALEAKVREAARAAGAADVRVGMTAERVTRRIIAVGSGKGGVGKSTLSANLAVAMAKMGRKVGLVDADIYGPSQPRLLATEGRKPEAENQKIHPVPSPWGVPMLSMGHLVQPGQAIAWRGPMAGNALGQLIDAHWGDAEILVVDLPPGTGDVQLTMLQKHKPAGAVIVSTPQDLALMDAARAIRLFEQGDVPLIGMVENMAGYVCPHCGETSDPFGSGGAEAAAKTMGLPFLGRVPLNLAIRQSSDAGEPMAAGDSPEAAIFAGIAQRVLAWLDAQKG